MVYTSLFVESENELHLKQGYCMIGKQNFIFILIYNVLKFKG
jgi:hypothetical protein